MGKLAAKIGLGIAVSCGALALSSPASAQPQAAIVVTLPAQPLATSLRAIARAADVEIIFASADVRGLRAPPISGRYTVDDALTLLLTGTGLSVETRGTTVIVRGRSQPPASGETADDKAEILVTGTRIRGGTPTSPTLVTSLEDLKDAGLPTLADYVRTIPQNFSGGQNPGVGIGVPGFTNFNLNSASSLNLRGLGPDATLTLLNGHRLAYGSAVQSIDIAAIPVAALDRIEIVPDGASAIYGSDAVGGVANVILRRDFSGLVTTTRLGLATDGGGEQQQYSGVAGTTWATGGVMLALDHERDKPIIARQRSYTSGFFPTATLLPYQRRESLVASGHQSLTSNLTLEIDGLYNRRWSRRNFAVEPTAPFDTYGILDLATTTTFSVAPRLRLNLGRWEVAASGVYGEDRTRYRSLFFFGGELLSDTPGCYCNAVRTAELSAEGPILHLPAGDTRLAIGGGYRENRLRASRPTNSFSGTQKSYFGYGELSVPLVAPEQDIPLVHRLSATGAVRYEDYGSTGNVATPKAGLIYSPSADFDLKGSWGKSFKAPTLYQQNIVQDASLYDAVSLGARGFPPTATAILIGSGNAELRPERATTWVASFVAHPVRFEGARIEVSYFDVNYRDRVVNPITFISQALSSPIYADLVTFGPSRAQIDTAVAQAGTSFFNTTGGVYDPTRVVAIADNRFLNVARQKLHGIDVQASYRAALADDSSLTFSGNASWLRSKQQLSAGQPPQGLAGTIFNPPNFRARGGIVWEIGALTASTFVNRIGHVDDERTAARMRIDGMTTVDAALRYAVGEEAGPFSGVELSLSVQNLLNDKPETIVTSQAYSTPYDSTNYSAIGRFINLTVAKRW